MPQRAGEVWQTLAIDLPTWVIEDPPYRPKVSAWLAVDADHISEPFVYRPGAFHHEAVWQSLLKVADDGEFGGYRPERIEVANESARNFPGRAP